MQNTLYADDIVLLAESQQDLQCLIDVLYQWCQAPGMIVNSDKSKVVHFRRDLSVQRAVGPFLYGESLLEVGDRYRYLGVVLIEFLVMSVTAKHIACAAHRALGLLIAKGQRHGDFPFEVFSKLYDSLVQQIMDYGASVWGHKSFSCIDAVQNRAMRYFLGVGKRTPVAAMQGDIGWSVPAHRQWLFVIRQWCRLAQMDPGRINKRVFIWAHTHAQEGKMTVLFHTVKFYQKHHMDHLCNINNDLVFQCMKEDINVLLTEYYENQWSLTINRECHSW